MEDWVEQLQNSVNTLDRLKLVVNVSPEEEEAITTLNTKWGTTPYFASLMDPDNLDCPIRKQVIPSMKETENRYGMPSYLIWEENRNIGEIRPDCIAQQYHDRIAVTVTDVCANYCRHCLRKELMLNRELKLRFGTRTPIEKGAELIRDAIRGHTTDLAQPMSLPPTSARFP
jgi:lysine 2,3-aminomutase